MTSPKSDAELLSSLDTAITDYGPGDSNDCIIYMTVGQARALRSRLTAETGVRDGALADEAYKQAVVILKEYGIKFIKNSATDLWLTSQLRTAEDRGRKLEVARVRAVASKLREALEEVEGAL